MKTILWFLLVLCASPALACSCLPDERTLEQRVDDAERVVRVRIVAAELTGDPGPTAEAYERWEQERIAYRLSPVESLKGADQPLPRLVGLAGTGGGDCTVRLEIGRDLILFIGAGEQEISFSQCSQPYEALPWYEDSTLLLDSVRRFARDRTPIHACDNLRSAAWERSAECEARQEEWSRRHERESSDGS
jgi:hypothetical protein